MIDIHCHILPQVDDGAWDLVESLSMAKLGWESGVHTIVATPHFRGTEDSLAKLALFADRFQLLKATLKRADIGLELLPGAEVLCLPQTIAMARQGQLPTLADTRYVLTEFYFDAEMEFIEEALEQLRSAGYRPVVAHPERYEAVQRRPERLEGWFRDGIVIQVNKGSPLGAFGPKAGATARELLDHGLVHILASDGHSSQRRTPHMGRIRQWAAEQLGERYARVLLEENPGRLIRNLEMKQAAM